MQRDFETLLPAACAELARLQAFLKKVEQLAKRGKLDEKAVMAIYRSMPEEMIRGLGRVTAKTPFMLQTKTVILELNRMFVTARKMRLKKD